MRGGRVADELISMEREVVAWFTDHFAMSPALSYDECLPLARELHWGRNDRQAQSIDYLDVILGDFELKPDALPALIDRAGDRGNGFNNSTVDRIRAVPSIQVVAAFSAKGWGWLCPTGSVSVLWRSYQDRRRRFSDVCDCEPGHEVH